MSNANGNTWVTPFLQPLVAGAEAANTKIQHSAVERDLPTYGTLYHYNS